MARAYGSSAHLLMKRETPTAKQRPAPLTARAIRNDTGTQPRSFVARPPATLRAG